MSSTAYALLQFSNSGDDGVTAGFLSEKDAHEAQDEVLREIWEYRAEFDDELGEYPGREAAHEALSGSGDNVYVEELTIYGPGEWEAEQARLFGHLDVA